MTGETQPSPPGLDPVALRRYLDAELTGQGTAGPLRMELIEGGRSNLTYLVSDGSAQWVARRPPLGHVLATAHDMGREVKVLRALAPTPVPVPRVFAYAAEPQALGAPCYIMERVDGVVLRGRAELAELAPDTATRLGHRLIDILAQLHRVDPAAVGLADFGRPDGYLQRQVARWAKQFAASRSRELPGMAELAERLAATIPTSGRGTIVHGDYRLDNVIVDSADPATVRAVLDWEMATLGDPLTDLGMFCMYYDGWKGLENPVTVTPADFPGFPGRDELVERYATATGADVTGLDWYVAFAYYKIAVVLEGIHFRHVQGQTVGDGFDRIGPVVPDLIARGIAATEGR